MKRVMLDTNTVSQLLKAEPNALKHLKAARVESLCISVITEGELRYGLAKRPQARRLHVAVTELLKRLDVLPWTGGTARRYGELRAGLERTGKPLAPLDMLIAAHALDVNALLATNDKAFRHVVGLKTENWTLP